MLDQAAKKSVLRSFTYGLYAVSASHEGERGIFTANWLTQVSFDPPMVAVSVERDSSTLPLILASQVFSVAPLKRGQRDLAGSLGRPRDKAGDKVAALGDQMTVTESGCIAFQGGLGYVVCRMTAQTTAGDSVVIVGEVIEATSAASGEPLTMAEAGFRHFG